MQQFCFACFGAQLDELQLQATWSCLGSFFSSSLLAPVLPCVGLPTHWIPVTCLPNPCELLTHLCITTYVHATSRSPNYLPPVTHLLPSWPPPFLIELLYHCWVVCLCAPWHWHNHNLTPLPRVGPQCSSLWLLLSSSWLLSFLLCIPLHAKLYVNIWTFVSPVQVMEFSKAWGCCLHLDHPLKVHFRHDCLFFVWVSLGNL
jgi:hypothetical protein